MIEKCTNVIVDWLIDCDALKEADKELYRYAVYSFLLSLTPLLLAIVFGVIAGNVWQNIVIVVPFMLLRKFSGGYHAKSPAVCLIGSCLLLLLCMILSLYIKAGWGLSFFTVAAVISLMVFSPIDSENRLLSREEKIRCKRAAIILAALFLVLDFIACLAGFHTVSVCISIGIMLSAGLQLPSILKIR